MDFARRHNMYAPIDTYRHTHTHAHTQACPHTYIHTRTHTHTQTHPHAQACPHTPTHKGTRTLQVTRFMRGHSVSCCQAGPFAFGPCTPSPPPALPSMPLSPLSCSPLRTTAPAPPPPPQPPPSFLPTTLPPPPAVWNGMGMCVHKCPCVYVCVIFNTSYQLLCLIMCEYCSENNICDL